MTQFVTRFKDDSVYLEIVGGIDDTNDYFVEFIDINTNNVEYSNTIKVNYWSQIDDISQKNITIKITSNDEVVFERNQNDKFNRVYVLFGSTALGDTVAWIPCVEEYRIINNVEVILHTSHNYLFDKAYPNIILVV